jgi:hypothetical protein
MMPNEVPGPERILTSEDVLTLPLTAVPDGTPPPPVPALGRDVYPDEIQPPVDNR